MFRHKLKTIEPYFSQLWRGEKTAELRLNDRDFQVGDTLELCDWGEDYGFGIRTVVATVSSVTMCKGLVEGYAMLGLSNVIRHIDRKDEYERRLTELQVENARILEINQGIIIENTELKVNKYALDEHEEIYGLLKGQYEGTGVELVKALIAELDQYKRTAFQAQEMAKEVAGKLDTFRQGVQKFIGVATAVDILRYDIPPSLERAWSQLLNSYKESRE